MTDTPEEQQPPQHVPLAGATARGPVGNTRSVWKSILWAILTLGIYTFVWVFRTQDEMKNYTGQGMGGWIAFIIYFVFSPITWFVIPSELKNMYMQDGREAPISAWWGLWFLLPLIGAFVWFLKVQPLLNDFWQSKGAPPPP
jgi:Domain of unknown function (DUF4234)